MEIERIRAEMTVDELLTRYPATARAFVRRRMACVGCELARFESLAEVCDAYRQPLGPLLADVNRLARGRRRRMTRLATQEADGE